MSESKTDINNLPTNNQEDKRASNFNVPKNQEIKLTPEQETAKEEMIIELSEGKIERALEIKERSNLSEETAQAAAKEGMIKQLSKQATQYVLGIKEKFNVSEEITQEVIKEVIIEKLSGGNIYAALEIKDNFERLNISDDVSEEIIDSPEIQKAIKKAIIKEMDNGSIFQPLRLIRELKILKLKDFISSSEFQKAAKKAAAKTLLLSERNSDKYIKELDALGGNIISSSEFQKAAKEEIIKGLNNEHIHAALRIKKEFNISEEVIGSPEIQKAAKKGIIRELRLKKVRDIYPQKVDRALLIKKEFNVPKEVIDSAEVQKVIKEEIIEYLNNDSVIQALEMKEGFNVPKEVIDSPEIQKIVEKIILERLSKKDPYSIKKLKKEFNVPEEKFKKLIQQGIRRELSQGNIDNAFEIMEESNIPKSFIDLPETQETIRQGMIKKLFDFKFREALLLKNEFNIPVIDINQKEFFKYVGEEKYTLEYIQNTIDMGIEKEIIQITDPNLENLIRNPKLRETLCLNELQQILKNNPDIELSELEKNVYQYKAEALESEGFLEELDQKAFQKLSDEFGSAEIAKFIGLEDRSAIHILKPNITKLYNKIKNQIGKKQFIGNILNQVQMDTSNYGENNVNDNYDFDYDDNYDYNNYENIDSYTQFNNIIGNLDYDFKKTLDEANKFSNPELQKLVKELAEKHPCSSWENMKKYNEICIILKDKEILEKLEVLNQEGKFKQYEFFSKLAFHPTSKISTTKVFEFMNNPAHFLDVEDAHSGKSHERKKPSNYIHFPHLDISAEDLRDALIEGDLDNLQYFPKSEIKYSFSNEEMEADELIDSLIKSFGRKYNGVKGIQRAKNVKEMFARVNQLCKENNLNIKELAQGSPDILKKITPELKQGLEELLFNEKIGIKDKRKKEEYIVKVHPKSSPQGHLAGNDTACCMPFGSGKNNVYMYNLGCAIMTIQKVNQDGTARTVTQSVLTPDVDIEQKVSELINKLESSRGKIHELIKSDLSQNQEIIITADNIEVAENYKGKKEKIIKYIYTNFLKEYAQELKEKGRNINQDKVVIGTGYTDALTNLDKDDNNYVPIMPPGYSDNTGSQSYILDIKRKEEKRGARTGEYKLNYQENPQSQTNVDLPKGIKLLTAEDTLRVSYMEGKIYADNESLIQYIHRIGNELIAKDINNQRKNRPNLSLKAENKDGDLEGYMIAYEGVIDKDEDKPESAIYVSDIAASPEKKLIGGKLLKAFAELVEEEYLKKDNPIPIIAEARDKTSYPIIQKQINKLGNKYGYIYEMEETESYHEGEDLIHVIILRPKKIEQDIKNNLQ